MFEALQFLSVSGIAIGAITEVIIPLFTQGVDLARTVL